MGSTSPCKMLKILRKNFDENLNNFRIFCMSRIFRPFWSPTVLYLEHGADGLQFFVVEILEDEGRHRRDDSDEEVGTRQRHEGRARWGSEINYTGKRTKKTSWFFFEKKTLEIDKKNRAFQT
jgi:hypothetical protein